MKLNEDTTIHQLPKRIANISMILRLVPNMSHCRLGFGISGANRYSYNMRGQLSHSPEATEFFDRIERMLDSNDVLDIRDIRLLIDFVA